MTDDITQAASDSVRKGEHIRERVRDVMLEALQARNFDRGAIRDVVRAVTEGVTHGAEGSRAGVRQALADGFRGMDLALTTSVQAGNEALRQLVATGRGISDHEVKQALAGLRKMEQDFVATVREVAESSNERVRPELGRLLREAAHAGTETGRQAAKLMAEFTFTGIELAGEFGVRFAQIASGMLAGMADALHGEKMQDQKKSK